MESHRSACDVDDRINLSNLVKRNLIRRLTVDPTFGLREPLVNLRRHFLDHARKMRLVKNVQNVAEFAMRDTLVMMVSMMMIVVMVAAMEMALSGLRAMTVLTRHMDVEMECGESTLIDALCAQLESVHGQLAYLADEPVKGQTRVDERTQNHIAACA